MEKTFDIEEIMKQISPHSNCKTLKSVRPKDGIAGYVWRMIRFHSGKDMHYPINCFFYLFDQMKAEGAIEKKFSGITDPEHKKILDKLDLIVMECSNRLGISNNTAAQRFKGILY